MTQFSKTDQLGVIELKSGQIGARFSFDAFKQGIVPTLRMFGRQLYYGYMHRDVFLYSYYLSVKHNMLNLFCAYPNDQSSEQQSTTMAFNLHLLRAIQNQQGWRWPAIINRDHLGRIDQVSGITRSFVTLMTWPEPWKHYPVLFCEDLHHDIHRTLVDPIKIENDDQLNTALGFTNDDTEWEPRAKLYLHLEPLDTDIYCKLHYIGDGSFHDANPKAGREFLDEYAAWRNRYGKPVKLAVYTQWPDMIINSQQMWDVEIVGTSEGMVIDGRMGYAERTVHRYHENPQHGDAHVLWMVNPRLIDLREICLWMDMTHSTYISQEWDFLVYRPQDTYKNTFISISRQED